MQVIRRLFIHKPVPVSPQKIPTENIKFCIFSETIRLYLKKYLYFCNQVLANRRDTTLLRQGV